MNLSHPFIQRPVATTLLTVGVVLAGAFAYLKLPVSPLPQVDYPTISVSASLPGADPETVVGEVAHWGLLPRARAAKAVEFLLHPTWRTYITCYVDGLRLCRRFVAGDPTRFGELLSDQLVPADLAA